MKLFEIKHNLVLVLETIWFWFWCGPYTMNPDVCWISKLNPNPSWSCLDLALLGSNCGHTADVATVWNLSMTQYFTHDSNVGFTTVWLKACLQVAFAWRHLPPGSHKQAWLDKGNTLHDCMICMFRIFLLRFHCGDWLTLLTFRLFRWHHIPCPNGCVPIRNTHNTTTCVPI